MATQRTETIADVQRTFNALTGRTVACKPLIWNTHRKDYMALVTNLDRDRFPPAHVYQIYRLRWQVELLCLRRRAAGAL